MFTTGDIISFVYIYGKHEDIAKLILAKYTFAVSCIPSNPFSLSIFLPSFLPPFLFCLSFFVITIIHSFIHSFFLSVIPSLCLLSFFFLFFEYLSFYLLWSSFLSILYLIIFFSIYLFSKLFFSLSFRTFVLAFFLSRCCCFLFLAVISTFTFDNDVIISIPY